ncbi:MAG: synthase subunit [Bacteroidota bacterium]|jgi:F-type H+-transporting ATPase subunit b
MELLKPELGLIFWTSILFILLLFILKKFAWAPILDMLKEREEGIATALQSAEKAKAEMAQLTADNQRILNEAKEEKSKILKEARDTYDKIVGEASEKAKAEAARLMAEAKRDIDNQKNAAMIEIKNQIGHLATEVAEKMIRKELKKDGEQMSYMNQLVNEIKLN